MKKRIYNPYLPCYEYIPDGEPYVFGDRVYIYGSHDHYGMNKYCGEEYVGWSAPIDDLSSWRCEGVIWHRDWDPVYKPGFEGMLHAPDVTKGLDGRYYLYYPLNLTSSIGVAVCDTPMGKYEYLGRIKHPDGTIYGCAKGDPLACDPAIFIDDDERIWMYAGYAPHNTELHEQLMQNGKGADSAYVVELEKDMLTIKRGPIRVAPSKFISDGTGFEGHGFFEASSMRKINGKYYFIYSSEHGHELCYATSDNPMGPFRYGGVIISNTDKGYEGNTQRKAIDGNNHGSVCQINGQYYIFYHRQTGAGLARQACAEKINIEKDGSIKQVCVTSCGLSSSPLPATGTYPAYIACNLINTSAHFAQDKSDGDTTANQYIEGIKNESVIGYKYFDFRNIGKISVSVKADSNGVIKVYSDGTDSSPVSVINISKTGGTASFSEKACFTDGVHSLFFKYEGEGEIDLFDFSFGA
ncbi:MAG: family 43 glycosylhydrolase [Clostridia bacterium]|nr:family 43 glycosylhydrolase [Clostridia bacterium]